MRPPRFRLRTLLVAVAVVALLMGGSVEVVRLRRQSAIYRDRADHHAAVEGVLRSIAARQGDGSPVDDSPGPGVRSKRFTARIMAEHEARLRLKYDRAVARPWRPVAPDPPPPD